MAVTKFPPRASNLLFPWLTTVCVKAPWSFLDRLLHRPRRVGRSGAALRQFDHVVPSGLHFKLPLGIDIAGVPSSASLRSSSGSAPKLDRADASWPANRVDEVKSMVTGD